MANNKRQKKQKAPDYLYEAIWAVKQYDEVRLGVREVKGETKETLHKKAVKAITLANNNFYPGYISISKARALMAAKAQREKAELLAEKEGQAAA